MYFTVHDQGRDNQWAIRTKREAGAQLTGSISYPPSTGAKEERPSSLQPEPAKMIPSLNTLAGQQTAIFSGFLSNDF